MVCPLSASATIAILAASGSVSNAVISASVELEVCAAMWMAFAPGGVRNAVIPKAIAATVGVKAATMVMAAKVCLNVATTAMAARVCPNVATMAPAAKVCLYVATMAMAAKVCLNVVMVMVMTTARALMTCLTCHCPGWRGLSCC